MPPRAGSPWAPFRYKVFAIVWTATVLSNIGGWMYNAAAGWLMTSLTRDAFVVSLVQVANTLPMFMFALAAGALSDIVDKRRFLIAGEVATAVLSAIFTAMVWFNFVTPASLLGFTFLIAIASAFTAPAWQAVVPELVPWKALPAAITANSAGVNVSRAVGPAIAGAMVGPLGIASPFVVNAVSNFGSIAALIWWREPRKTKSALRAEPFGSAIRIGFRYAANSPGLRGTLVRAVAFFFFASAYWALLPLVARSRVGGGPEIYGLLLGTIGLGAVAGAFVMPSLKVRLGPDRLVAVASVGHGGRVNAFRNSARRALGFVGKRHRGRFLDRSHRNDQRVRAACLTRLGARPRTGNVHDGFLRIANPRERGLGPSRRHDQLVHRASRGRCRRAYRSPAHLAVEAANRRGTRSHALDAMAGADPVASRRGERRTGARDD